MKKIFSITFFLFLAVALSTSFFACKPSGRVTERVKVTLDEVVSILASDKVMAEKEKMIRSAMDETFDWTGMAHNAISEYWDERTKAEQKEFTDLFADMIQLTLMFNLIRFSDGKIHYLHEKVNGSSAVVATKIVKDGVETLLDFQLSKEKGSWLVTDFSVNYVSMVKEHGLHLRNGIKKYGYENLIGMLKTIIN